MSPRGRKPVIALLFALLMLAMPYAAIAMDAAVQPKDIVVSPSTSSITLKGGQSQDVWLDIHNKLPYSEQEPNTVVVYVGFRDIDQLDVDFPEGQRVEVDGQKVGFCHIVVSVSEFAHTEYLSISFDITINDPSREAPITKVVSDIIRVQINSNYQSEEYINKFMGLWPNNLPGVFGSNLFTAIMSLVLCIMISDMISFLLYPRLVVRLRRKDWFNRMFPRKDLAFELNRLLFIFLLMVSVYITSRIYGLDEFFVAMQFTLMKLYGTVLGAALLWWCYGFLLSKFLAWFDDDITDGKNSSLYSLLFIIGRILIVVCAVYLMLVTLGVESTAATLVSAGVGLALSFGAQSTITQFFGGLLLLTTRPFSVGDVIRFEGDDTVLRVVSIGLMNTRFKEWDTDEILVMPNSKVSEATVVNMTAGKRMFNHTLFMDLPLMEDYSEVKACLKEAMSKVMHVVPGELDFELEDIRDDVATVKLVVTVDDIELYQETLSECRENIMRVLHEHGIEVLPHHRSDVYLRDERD